jgi:hypothetical protein
MLKDIPEEMHAHLKKEAEANFRSLTQEALESGPEAPLSRTRFDTAFRKAWRRFEESKKAAL